MQAGGRNQKEHRLGRSNPVECRGQNIRKGVIRMIVEKKKLESLEIDIKKRIFKLNEIGRAHV